MLFFYLILGWILGVIHNSDILKNQDHPNLNFDLVVAVSRRTDRRLATMLAAIIFVINFFSIHSPPLFSEFLRLTIGKTVNRYMGYESDKYHIRYYSLHAMRFDLCWKSLDFFNNSRFICQIKP